MTVGRRKANVVKTARLAGERSDHPVVANSPAARQAKVEIREKVLAKIGSHDARVLDLFCGEGEMFRAVWQNAASYVGVDARPWNVSHPPRFVADNRRLMRAIDLGHFNVFDLDAFGSCWEQLEILLHRRHWTPGEKGAIVLTDGSGTRARMGRFPDAMTRVTGLKVAPTLVASTKQIQRKALEIWLEKSHVRPTGWWQGTSDAAAGALVMYVGITFES